MAGLQRRYVEMADELAVGGEGASALDVFETAYDDTALNRYRARFHGLAEPIYDREIERLKALTGVDLVNPYRYTKREMLRGNAEGLTGSSYERFEMARARLADQRPELAGQINAGSHTLADLYKQQRALEKRAEEAIDASPLTVNVWLLGKLNPVAMAGGMTAAFEDPVGWLENIVGFGGGATQGAKGLLWASTKAAAANAGVTAAVQPLVQDWRRQAGMDFGWDRAAQETLLAGVLGFGLDAGVRTGLRVVQPRRGLEPVLAEDQTISGWRRPEPGERAVARGADPIEALEQAASRAPPEHPLAKAAAGDDEALLQVARESGAVDADPAVRGAAQELERFRLFGPPPEVERLDHYVALAEAIQRSADPEAPAPGQTIMARPRSGFKTEKGSVYNLHDDGTTSRNKAQRSDVGHEGDFGPKPRTELTYYVAAADGQRLAPPASSEWRIVDHGDGTVSLAVKREDGKWGISPSQRNVSVEKTPMLGFQPLEMWGRGETNGLPSYGKLHLGNKIVDLYKPSTLSPELQVARQRLIDQEGSPLDMARLMREAPELVDGSLHLSDHKTKQALALAKLSPEAFEMVAAGAVAPNHATVVARHVADASRHAEILQQVAAAGLRSEAQVKMLVGELTSRAGDAQVHAARTGSHEGVRELAAERAKVLDSGLKALLREPRVAGVIESEVARLEAALPETMRGNKKLRADLGKRVTDLVEALSREPDSTVHGLVQDAALALESGTGIRVASRALASRIADIVERDGLAGLARMAERKQETLQARGFSDPMGPEAQAQVKELANRVKLSLPDDGGTRGRRSAAARSAPQGGRGESTGRGDAGAGRAAAGGERGAGRGAQGRLDAGADGRPVGSVGNFAFGDDFTGTVIATRDVDGANQRYYWVHKRGASLPSERASAATVERMLSQMGNWIAVIDVTEALPGRWKVGMVRVDPRHQRQHIASRLYEAIERDVGGPILASGTMLEKGYLFWKRRDPRQVEHYRWLDEDGMWLSPKSLLLEREVIDRQVLRSKRLTAADLKEALQRRAEIDRLLDTIPAEAKSEAYLRETFSLRDPVEPRAAVAPDWEQIRAEVDEALRLLPREVRARVDERIVFGGRDVDGIWDNTERLIRIALNERAPVTARHEVMHALRDLGLVSNEEWMVMAARAQRLYGEMNVEGRWRKALEEAYPDDPHKVDAALLEEAVAEMFGRWKGGARYGGVIDRVFQVIHELLERINNGLRGRGFQSVDDVFRRIERGEVSMRSESLDRTSALPKFSLKAMPHDASFDHLADWLGIDPHRIVIDATHIAAKRRKKTQTIEGDNLSNWQRLRNEGLAERGIGEVDQRLMTEDGVMSFVREVLAQGMTARKYKVGDSWSVTVDRPDGTEWLVSIDGTPNENGQHLIRTVFVNPRSAVNRALPAVLDTHGLAGLRWRGDPAGLESLLANLSEAQRAAPGRIPDSVLEVVGQHLEIARQMKAELRDEKLRAGFERMSNDMIQAEVRRSVEMRPEVAEAQRISDLSDFAGACKS